MRRPERKATIKSRTFLSWGTQGSAHQELYPTRKEYWSRKTRVSSFSRVGIGSFSKRQQFKERRGDEPNHPFKSP
ncbi:hypothetical protein LF1_24620 [Rubripirellula obstinata]|uniref:Uncharacterized protein n=1 Tax=Rubripirellula obstinata TaxID=406547 RepID=A0A5B1CJ27_9BACT|nr:hypothetical protein LF1_24620 [Rubripirellula obstinata]